MPRVATQARAYQSISLDNTSRTGRYEPWEDVIVMRDDRTLLQIALQLHRKYQSVAYRRRQLRKKAATEKATA